jgi:Holliday junction resolvase RusA-like endonuclease
VLLSPHIPAQPVPGPLSLSLRLVYPHLKGAKKADRDKLLPKASKPDIDNVAKHLIDLLSRLRFIEDDQSVSRLTIEKFYGPESLVGINIQIAPTL